MKENLYNELLLEYQNDLTNELKKFLTKKSMNFNFQNENIDKFTYQYDVNIEKGTIKLSIFDESCELLFKQIVTINGNIVDYTVTQFVIDFHLNFSKILQEIEEKLIRDFDGELNSSVLKERLFNYIENLDIFTVEELKYLHGKPIANPTLIGDNYVGIFNCKPIFYISKANQLFFKYESYFGYDFEYKILSDINAYSSTINDEDKLIELMENKLTLYGTFYYRDLVVKFNAILRETIDNNIKHNKRVLFVDVDYSKITNVNYLQLNNYYSAIIYKTFFIPAESIVSALNNYIRIKKFKYDWCYLDSLTGVDYINNKVSYYIKENEFFKYQKHLKDLAQELYSLDFTNRELLDNNLIKFGNANYDTYLYRSVNYNFIFEGSDYASYFIKIKKFKMNIVVHFKDNEVISESQMVKAKRKYKNSL